MKDSFSAYHPAICFGFFSLVIAITIFVMHPAFLLLSFFAALAYGGYMKGRSVLSFFLFFGIPIFAFSVIANSLFGQKGDTLLLSLGRFSVTLESVAFGLISGLMIVTVLLWFFAYSQVMTTDKFMFLFGKLSPSLSLIFSMALNFLPLFQSRAKEIFRAQNLLGNNSFEKGPAKWRRLLVQGVRVFSTMATWSLESSIDTSDSMKARGYALKGKTSFSIHKLRFDDLVIVFLGLLLMVIIIFGVIRGVTAVSFFPTFDLAFSSLEFSISLFAFGVLVFLPLLINVKDWILWKYLRSKI